MRYLIISIYDSGYGFSVCVNGKVLHKYDEVGWSINKEIEPYWDIFNNLNNYEEEFAKLDFDLIVLCEDGATNILKEVSQWTEV